MEWYRSGHNEVDSKSIGCCISATWVRIPPTPPINEGRFLQVKIYHLWTCYIGGKSDKRKTKANY